MNRICGFSVVVFADFSIFFTIENSQNLPPQKGFSYFFNSDSKVNRNLYGCCYLKQK